MNSSSSAGGNYQHTIHLGRNSAGSHLPAPANRPSRADSDLAARGVRPQEDDPFGFFGHRSVNGLQRRFAADGMISDDAGQLAVQTPDGTLLGSVDWFAVRLGPSSSARALNIGIFLLPEHRGRGYGSAAQAVFADYLFANTLVERLEAGTDVDNIAEQRALQRGRVS